MTFEDQKRMVQELTRCMSKMNAEEKRAFDMMVKRQKDDEDFDELTRQQLTKLYEKYFPKHSKEELEKAWDRLFKNSQE